MFDILTSLHKIPINDGHRVKSYIFHVSPLTVKTERQLPKQAGPLATHCPSTVAHCKNALMSGHGAMVDVKWMVNGWFIREKSINGCVWKGCIHPKIWTFIGAMMINQWIWGYSKNLDKALWAINDHPVSTWLGNMFENTLAMLHVYNHVHVFNLATSMEHMFEHVKTEFLHLSGSFLKWGSPPQIDGL